MHIKRTKLKVISYSFLCVFIQAQMIGDVTALATFSSRKCWGSRNCKFKACFSILILVIDAASLVFILSKHVSISVTREKEREEERKHIPRAPIGSTRVEKMII